VRETETIVPRWLPNDAAQPLDVPSIPYLERQAVLVVDDDRARRSREALIAARSGAVTKSFRGLVAREEDKSSGWIGLVWAAFPAGLLGPLLLTGLSRAPAVFKAYRAWRGARVSALVISAEEARQLNWPRGDPNRHELYIGSPADRRTYYPTASFHEDVLFERYGELRELLSRIGATRIHARVTRGRGFDGSIHGEAPVSDAVTVGAGGGAHKHEQSAREDVRELKPSRPTSREEIAEGLAWFSREKDWQRLADLALAGRAARETIYFRQSNDFGLNANFEAAVKNLPVSVKIGGDYRQYVDTVWEVDAIFGEA